MSIDTGLSNSVFNVLKYLIISVILEAIVRSSLDYVENFFRAVDLNYGRPVSLHPPRIDRYNLFAIFRSRKLPRLLFCTFLACCAYIVEILLEFSSDAKENQFPVPGTLDLYQPTHPACTTSQLDSNNIKDLVIDMARTCVVVTDDEYTFYNVTWQREGTSSPLPICIHTRNNILRQGSRIYKQINYANGTREASSISGFEQALRANSWQSNGDRERYTVTFPITSADVQSTSFYLVDGRKYTRAVLLSRVRTTGIHCVSTAYGRHGDGIMSLAMYGCFQDIPYGRNCYQTLGTALVEVDAEFVDSTSWNTTSNITLGRGVYNFTRDVVDSRDLESVIALTMLLSAEFSVEEDMINKYAAVYKHCSDYLVPQKSDVSRVQTFRNAESEQRVTISVSIWAIIVLVVWPSLLTLTSIAFRLLARKKNLPKNVQGEGGIGRRWMSRISNSTDIAPNPVEGFKNLRVFKLARDKRLWRFNKPVDVFLNVETGETEDDIVVGPNVLHVYRDLSHAFKRI